MENTKTPFFQPFFRLTIIALTFFVFASSEAWAEEKKLHQEDQKKIMLADATKLKRKEMSTIRAGFIDPSGFIFKFAVDVQTQIDGALAYVRSLVITPNARKRFDAVTSTQVVTETAASKITNNGKGAVISSKDGGTTAILTQSEKGTFANIILNTADNKNITQNMNIDLVLHNLEGTFGSLSSLKDANLPSGLRRAARMHTIGFGF